LVHAGLRGINSAHINRCEGAIFSGARHVAQFNDVILGEYVIHAHVYVFSVTFAAHDIDVAYGDAGTLVSVGRYIEIPYLGTCYVVLVLTGSSRGLVFQVCSVELDKVVVYHYIEGKTVTYLTSPWGRHTR